jgi:uncharacterized membrane protein
MLKTYLIALLTLMVLDGLWLGVFMKGVYNREMGQLMAESVNWLPAALFYLGYPLGVVLLVLTPTPENGLNAALRGAMLGAVAYGTYNLTGAAVIKGWSSTLTLIDIAWGICLTSGMAFAAWRFTK